MDIGALASSLDFDALFASFSASNDQEQEQEEEEEYRFDRFVDAVEAAFELAFAHFVERTSLATHETLELAVLVLSDVSPERGARAREKVDLANAVKNASVILFGPMVEHEELDPMT